MDGYRMAKVTQEEIIEAVRRAAETTGAPMSCTDFARISGIRKDQVYQAFPDGGWSEVRRIVGLGRHPNDHHYSEVSDDDLLTEFHRVATALGQLPNWKEFVRNAKVSKDVARKRLGGLRGALDRYRDWLNEHEPDSPFLQQLQVKVAPTANGQVTIDEQPAVWAKGTGPQFGPPMDFRG